MSKTHVIIRNPNSHIDMLAERHKNLESALAEIRKKKMDALDKRMKSCENAPIETQNVHKYCDDDRIESFLLACISRLDEQLKRWEMFRKNIQTRGKDDEKLQSVEKFEVSCEVYQEVHPVAQQNDLQQNVSLQNEVQQSESLEGKLLQKKPSQGKLLRVGGVRRSRSGRRPARVLKTLIVRVCCQRSVLTLGVTVSSSPSVFLAVGLLPEHHPNAMVTALSNVYSPWDPGKI